MEHVGSLLLGLGNGGVFAALGLALVLTYRSSGVINFATGAIALYVAYTYASLRDGELFVLIPGLPRQVDIGAAVGLSPGGAHLPGDRGAARRVAVPGGVPAAARGARRWRGRWRRWACWS